MGVDRSKNLVLLEHQNFPTAAPKPSITLVDAIALIVGLVIGAGIFETPAFVAANTGTSGGVIQIWLLGGVVSLLGALCYAELATTYPHVGGNYYYLKRAFGQPLAVLFAWARMTVIQTGSIALLAFVLGDYASQLFAFGDYSTSIYAVIAIAVLTALNIVGLRQSKQLQNWLALALILGLGLVILLGLAFSPPVVAGTSTAALTATPSWGLALVFVLLSYGGWNEAAYISAEISNPQRNIVRSLLWSIGIITGTYLLLNLAYLRGLGVADMATSQAVAADLVRRSLGEPGAAFVSGLVVLATLSSINATILTGARTSFALGQDISPFRWLGHWQPQPSSPTTAYLLQGAIALILVGLGTLTRKGFETMVDYTAPIFWGFFLLSTLSLIILRIREPLRFRPFRVPLYPIVPILFCVVCGYLLYSSLIYTGIGAIAGVIVVLLGLPFVRRTT
ncbi:APC family permease [Pantanalinema sp. GBBB05]|uniref:APC family permease n=1 Tax=Pantanalinema sp. GBBB05 TaxID=2604139 RepID=UPI001DD08C2F|nr:amino acid permease [Pantanalinema sp. GBBB05]